MKSNTVRAAKTNGKEAGHLSGPDAKALLRLVALVEEKYSDLPPQKRGALIRQSLGDSDTAREMVQRLLPQFYEDVYGPSASSEASGNSLSGRASLPRAKSL